MASNPAAPNKRYFVRLGEEPPETTVISVPSTDVELLHRAMALLDEMRNADFLPEEFDAEYRALATSWKSRHG